MSEWSSSTNPYPDRPRLVNDPLGSNSTFYSMGGDEGGEREEVQEDDARPLDADSKERDERAGDERTEVGRDRKQGERKDRLRVTTGGTIVGIVNDDKEVEDDGDLLEDDDKDRLTTAIPSDRTNDSHSPWAEPNLLNMARNVNAPLSQRPPEQDDYDERLKDVLESDDSEQETTTLDDVSIRQGKKGEDEGEMSSGVMEESHEVALEEEEEDEDEEELGEFTAAQLRVRHPYR